MNFLGSFCQIFSAAWTAGIAKGRCVPDSQARMPNAPEEYWPQINAD